MQKQQVSWLLSSPDFPECEEKAQSIQDVLAGLEERRVVLIRQQAAEQNKAYQSLLIMNGQHTEFNRLLGLGNELLQQRQGLVNVPLRLPQAALDDKQQNALNNTERELTLSRMKGEARERTRLGYVADDLGFVGMPIRRQGKLISTTRWKHGVTTRRISQRYVVENRKQKNGRCL